MPANLPPQFYALSMKLKEAAENSEKISILEEMLRISPKHKGTERLQEDLKTKIAKLKKQRPKKIKGKNIYSIKKEGAGQVVIAGPTNSGKSSLFCALTNANAKVAPYPFTTKIPQRAMMPYENILIQLVDTPPLSPEFSPPWLKEILKAADILLAVFDLSKEDVAKDIEDFKEILDNWKFLEKKIIFLGNKIDLEKANENLKNVRAQNKVTPISCLKKIGLEELKKEIFDSLQIIRVYTKTRNKPELDFSHPFILKKGGKLITLASQIRQDFLSAFKYAKLYKKNTKKPKIVGKDYILQDGDIIEIYS